MRANRRICYKKGFVPDSIQVNSVFLNKNFVRKAADFSTLKKSLLGFQATGVTIATITVSVQF